MSPRLACSFVCGLLTLALPPGARAQAPVPPGAAPSVPEVRPTADASPVRARPPSLPAEPVRVRPAARPDRPAPPVIPAPRQGQARGKAGSRAKLWDKLVKLVGGPQLQVEMHGVFKAVYGEGKSPAGQKNVTFNDFRVARGYLGVRVKPVKWFEARLVVDALQDTTRTDTELDTDSGPFNVRLKFLYGRFVLPIETEVVTEPYVMVGMISNPWHPYEEGFMAYRMQGTIFAERNKLFGSADLGVMFGALLGRKLPERYQREVSASEPGSLGSIAIGVYNGGGYGNLEMNQDKAVMMRVAWRPAMHWHPNLQLAYGLAWGRGNVDFTLPEYTGALPVWRNHLFQASYDHRYFVTYAQAVFGTGNARPDASWLNADLTTRPFKGATGFLEVRLPWIRSSVIARYDWFDGPNSSGKPYHRLITGFAFHFLGRNKNVILLDYDRVVYDGIPDVWSLTLTLQVKL